MKALKAVGIYLVTLATFLALDGVWLGLVARDFYRRELGHLLSPTVRWVPAALFYLLYIAVLLILVVVPNSKRRLVRTVLLGGLFGLCAYATYDLTNLATVSGWPASVALADMVWGAVVTASVAGVGHGLARRLGHPPAAGKSGPAISGSSLT
ncbi:MAG: DUF2177 family protein [Acidobacteriota bacterium]